MVAISNQYSVGADKAAQIRQAVFFIKGHSPNFDTKTAKSPYKYGYQIFIMNGSFGFKFFRKFQHCSIFYAHATDYFGLEVLTFKMVIKVSA